MVVVATISTTMSAESRLAIIVVRRLPLLHACTKLGASMFIHSVFTKFNMAAGRHLGFIYLFIAFFSYLPTGQTRGWIFIRDSSKVVKSRKDVPFWSYKT